MALEVAAPVKRRRKVTAVQAAALRWQTPVLKHRSFKAAEATIDDKGLVEAYVSVYGNVDSYGEICDFGCFSKSLAKRLPVIAWSHDWKTIIGKTIEAEEVAAGDPRLPAKIRQYGGLRVVGQFIMDVQAGSDAFKTVKFMGDRMEFSIGYAEVETKQKDDGLHLTELDLMEWSPVLAGANDLTTPVGVKAAPRIELKINGQDATDEQIAALTKVLGQVEEHQIEAAGDEKKAKRDAGIKGYTEKHPLTAEQKAAVAALVAKWKPDLAGEMDEQYVENVLYAFYAALDELMWGDWDGDGDAPAYGAFGEDLRVGLMELCAQMQALLDAAPTQDGQSTMDITGDGDDMEPADPVTPGQVYVSGKPVTGAKEGQVLNKTNKERLKAIHDAAVAMGSSADMTVCDAGDDAKVAEPAKGAEAGAGSQAGTAPVTVTEEDAKAAERVAKITERMSNAYLGIEKALGRLGIDLTQEIKKGN